MQIGCTLKTIRFHKKRYHLLCWYIGSVRIAGKQGYQHIVFRWCTCRICRMGREWCTEVPTDKFIDVKFWIFHWVVTLICFEIFVVFSYDWKYVAFSSSAWFRLRAETSIYTLRNASGCKQRLDTCQFINNKVPHLSCLIWCLVAESQFRDIDNLPERWGIAASWPNHPAAYRDVIPWSQ